MRIRDGSMLGPNIFFFIATLERCYISHPFRILAIVLSRPVTLQNMECIV